MVMDTIQVRLSQGLVKKIDLLVDSGIYSSRSDVLRDAARRLVLDKMIGILSCEGDSVKEIREIRNRLAKEKFDLDKINRFLD